VRVGRAGAESGSAVRRTPRVLVPIVRFRSSADVVVIHLIVARSTLAAFWCCAATRNGQKS
jgi:hypothetical protein